MARLHEYQGKALLANMGITVPEGGPAASETEAEHIAAELGRPVVVKMQAWTTKRADQGGIKVADDPAAAKKAAAEMLGRRVGQFTVERVLVEEKLFIKNEYYAAVIVDDAARKQLVLFATGGGTGIEDRAATGELRLARTHA
ncbi:MAG: acetate--CoA ligase family protein, partial [Phycisphaerales bacterium]